MLRYTQKDVVAISFKNKEKKNYFNINQDIVYDTINHLDYAEARDLNILDIGEDTVVRECDYCGELLYKKRDGQDSRMYKNKYVDKESEYPCTDDCCKKCIGKKNKIIFFEKHGVMTNVNAFTTMSKNGKVPTSRQQIYLADILNGELNRYYKGVGFVDIVLENRKLIIEYDGSGHFMGISFGKYTYDEKILSDYDRDEAMKELGYRVVRIYSRYDYLPSEEVILEEIRKLELDFNETGKSFAQIIIPSSKKDKTYGDLREVKELDLNR